MKDPARINDLLDELEGVSEVASTSLRLLLPIVLS